MKKNILVLFCWGTISMTKNLETWSLDVANGADQLFKIEPRIVELANIDVHFVVNIDSTNATPKLWEDIGDIIQEKYDQYDGFLITTGTNTMAYMASALSFSLTNLGKPVIITGAQIPAEIISTDGRNNLVNALRIATMDLGGVFVVFGSKLILWCRSKKLSESELDAFGSFNAKEFGEIGIGVRINYETHKLHDEKLMLKNGFDDNIMSITLFPGISNEYLLKMIDMGVRWFVLRGYGTGDVSEYIFPFLKKAQENEVPVVVTTQCRGSTVMWIDSVWLEALKFGVIESYDMSIESMTTKLMRCIKQWIPYKDMKHIMQQNLHGEINTTQVKFFRSKELQESIENI